MNKAIVSGANGFLGSALIRELLTHNIEVIALVHKGHSSHLREVCGENPLLTVCPFDLHEAFEAQERLKDAGADTFYHFAWEGSAGPARADTGLQLANAQWTVDCLRLAKAVGCSRFVNAGSIMESETYQAVFREENRPGAGYIYGGGKLAAHTMCKPVAAQIGIDLLWAIITNVYGVGERSPRMVNTTIQKCIRGEAPQFTAGTQNYDFVYIDDAARAFYRIGAYGKPFCEYVIGSSAAKPLKEFLLEMKEAIAPELDFLFGDVPFTGVNLPLEAFDCRKTEEDTGFRAEISFGEGCIRTRDWWIPILEE